MSDQTHMIVRCRAGEKLPGPVVKLLATEQVQKGTGTNMETVYVVVVLVDA